MGQVYRARDTRLQRSVAIKILHDAGALDPERRRRFAQEAVAASALNHPNIITVYDVGIESDTPYLVSELIEGTSLRVEMNRGRLPLKRTIEIVHQVAEGLAAAHDAGIVHRDLKPENVMVTADGRVKIVDFGLAKTDVADELVGAPTATQTAAGLIVGTVPYMSPEQARGGKADFRSDQFALGVMLYEMTTATHPFTRETAVQTLSAIIAEEPPDPAKAHPALPLAVRWLIRRLLAKNPRERFAHTADLAADLRVIREFLGEATSAITTPIVAPRAKWQMRAAVIAVLAALAANAFLLVRVLGLEDLGVRFEKYTPLATDAGYQGEPAWSPDGKSIAYSAEIDGVVQIFTRTLGSAMRTKITNSTFDCYSPVWSSDGFIYYHALARDRDALWRVSPAGGAPEVVIENATPRISPPTARRWRFSETRGRQTVLAWVCGSRPLPTASRSDMHGGLSRTRLAPSGQVRFSPDGSKLMVWGGPDQGDATRLLGDRPAGRRSARTADRVHARAVPDFRVFSWLPDNRHVVVTRADGVDPGDASVARGHAHRPVSSR